LISVVDAAEAAAAAAGGAEIIDVKDPSTGSLGRAPESWVRAIRSATPSHLPVSAALGDGPFGAGAAGAARALAETGTSYVKVGLRDTSAEAARDVLGAMRREMPAGVRLIAVGFADARIARCPDPGVLPELAAAAGADGCLIDTALKDGRGLLDWLDIGPLTAFVGDCRARGLLAGLAGSLRSVDLPRIAAIRPDIVGVRGAACDGDRVRGRISRQRVADLRLQLRAEPLGARPLLP
jgi:hypothetical protein